MSDMLEDFAFPVRRMYSSDASSSTIFEAFYVKELNAKKIKKLDPVIIEGISMNHCLLDVSYIPEKSTTEILKNFPFLLGSVEKINRSKKIVFGKPKIMGIANATPDSFFPDSRISSTRDLDRLIDLKPDVIDVGGASTRPGSKEISVESEISRLRPYIEYLYTTSNIPLSLDTRHPETAKKFAQYISFLNDISGFTNNDMVQVALDNRIKCIVMHMRGTPENMQDQTVYSDIVPEVISFLHKQARNLLEAGISTDDIIVDPGIGFGKDINGNLSILHDIKSFEFGPDLLVGTSRKGFLGKITGEDVTGRLPGTIATSIYLAQNHVDYLRVHDVKENRDAIEVMEKMYLE